MAIKRIYSEKDASIGNKRIFPEIDVYRNEGRDEILEIGKFQDQYGIVQEKRILIKFPSTEIQNTISQISGSYTAILTLKHCSVRGILKPRVFSISNISGSWTEGTGKKYETQYNKVSDVQTTEYIFQEESHIEEQPQECVISSTQTKGVNWKNKTGMEGSEWATPGGDIYSGSLTSTYPSSNQELDLTFDVTSLLPATVDGFLLKIEDEYVGESYLHHFFSRDTHTVYQPHLDIKWRDQEWGNYGTGLPSGKDYHVEISPQSLELYPEQEVKLYLSPKVKYPVRTFSTSSLYVQPYTLPSSSVWRVVDDQTNQPLVEFDPEYTLLHSDQNGNYIKFNTSILEPDRYYRIEVKTFDNDTFRILDTKVPFKLK